MTTSTTQNVSIQDVKRVAELARLELSSDESNHQLEKLQNQFLKILNHFQSLNEANTEGVEPLYHLLDEMPLRDDQPQTSLSQERLLQNAPDAQEHCFRLPRVVGSEE